MPVHDITTPATAGRLRAGLNGDPDQRAATELLISAAGGVWLAKLATWDQYLCPTQDSRRPDGLWIDWDALRQDLAADDHAWAEFTAWVQSYEGRRASDDQHEARRTEMVPDRPWHGASSSELVLLRIAVQIGPGGLLADGIARLDDTNRAAVAAAIDTLIDGQYIAPHWAPS
jgi:hypothetical protein